MTPEDVRSLISSAEKAMANARAPYSGFRVGAALLADDGLTYTGCNVENHSLMLSVCAERIAILKALSEGASSFKAIAIVSSEGGYCLPCGACRQLLYEFAPSADVYLKAEEGVKKYGIGELLPHPFEKGE